jgi:chromosome segregation ATPase
VLQVVDLDMELAATTSSLTAAKAESSRVEGGREALTLDQRALRAEIKELTERAGAAEAAADREMRRTASLEAKCQGHTETAERTRMRMVELEGALEGARSREDCAHAEATKAKALGQAATATRDALLQELDDARATFHRELEVAKVAPLKVALLYATSD